jgi:alpha-L-rhamnosidase
MAGTTFGATGEGIQVSDLKTEYTDNPLGIDVTKPRLSWKLMSAERGQYQTAYHIQVASSQEKLSGNNPDIWDSGKIESSQSVNVVYDGLPLESAKRYFWRVQVWDRNEQTIHGVNRPGGKWVFLRKRIGRLSGSD